jgi:hypothetical protein
MSSVAPLGALTVPAGDGLVNAVSLDAQIQSIVSQVNALIAVVEKIRDSASRFKDGSVEWRMLSDECVRSIQDLTATIAGIRRGYALNWSPSLAPTAADLAGAIRDNSDTIPFLTGVTPEDAGLAPALVVGPADGRVYEVRTRLRSVARGVVTIAVVPQSGADPANRLFVGGSMAMPTETSGIVVSDPALTIQTNALQEIIPSPPTIVLTADPVLGDFPLLVTFDAVITGQAPLAVTLDFGDGSPVVTPVWPQTHLYESAGTFTAVATVTDAYAQEGSDTADIETQYLVGYRVTLTGVQFPGTYVNRTSPTPPSGMSDSMMLLDTAPAVVVFEVPLTGSVVHPTQSTDVRYYQFVNQGGTNDDYPMNWVCGMFAAGAAFDVTIGGDNPGRVEWAKATDVPVGVLTPSTNVAPLITDQLNEWGQNAEQFATGGTILIEKMLSPTRSVQISIQGQGDFDYADTTGTYLGNNHTGTNYFRNFSDIPLLFSITNNDVPWSIVKQPGESHAFSGAFYADAFSVSWEPAP